jgi:hypothetical protein
LVTATNQYVNVTNFTPLASNYTFSAWVYLCEGGNFSSARSAILSSTNSKSDGSLNSIEVLVRSASASYTDPQYLELGRSGAFNGTASTSSVPTNQWVHLAVTVSSARLVNYYINGAASGSWDASGNDVTINTNIALANNALTGRKFRGMLDEAQIWSRVLSQTEIQTNMNRAYTGSDTNLIAYWRFDNSATNSAPAYPGLRDGTPANSPTYTNSGIPFVPDAATSSASAIGPSNATLNGTVNPGNLATAAWFAWGTTTNYGNLTAATTFPATNGIFFVTNLLTGLTPGRTYYYQLVASNSAGVTAGAGASWTNLSIPPTAATSAASGVKVTSATLNGTVNPNYLATTAWFEWGTDTHYSNLTATTLFPATNRALFVTNLLTGLTPGRTYYYRLVASNSAGTNRGSDASFTNQTLPPTVTTLAASNLKFTNAILNATVNPNGMATTAWFEWGADTHYGNTLGLTNLTAGTATVALSTVLAGLNPAQMYHGRAAATNAAGLTTGADEVFTTGMTNTVTSLADDGGSGTLRHLITSAYSGQMIVFATNGTITLTNGELVVANSLTFVGPGATNLSISGNTNSRVFNITNPSAVVVISDMTICNGKAANGSNGGGVYNVGILTLSACTLSANTAGNGDSGGSAGHGGGVYNAGTLTLSACTLSANTAGDGGDGGDVGQYSNGNGGPGYPGGNGGGVYNAGTLTLSACTFTTNTAGKGGNGGPGGQSHGNSGNDGSGGNGGNGGGVFNTTNASLATLHNSLFALNAAGTGGTNHGNGPIGTAGSDPDLSGAFTSLGHNLVRITGNSTGLVNGANGDIVGTAASPIHALLGPLTNNGGPTPTIALLPGSPAIDAGDDTLTGTDQRGYARLSGAHVDIGAYELNAASLGYSAPALGSVSCTVSNLASGTSSATFTFSDNPNGLNTTAWIDYGISPSYGGATTTLSLGYTNVPVTTNLTVTGFAPGTTYHYRLSAYNPAGTTTGADQTFTTTVSGDLNGDGVVSDTELQTFQASYWQSHPLVMTGLSGAGSGTMSVGLSNSARPGFAVLASTNLSNWVTLTNGLSIRYQINDPDAKLYPKRFYRLRTE